MSPARLGIILAYVGMSERELGRRTGYSAGAVQKWSNGLARVPAPVAFWLERLLAHHKANPEPKPPRRTA